MNRLVFLIVSLSLFLCLSVGINFFFLYQQSERNRVKWVVDGDSFDLKDGRRIRLLGIDAPDLGRCFYAKSKNRLFQLIDNKRVRLTDLVTDDYGRVLANVFVGKNFVNQIMVEEGMARFLYVSSPYFGQLKQAAATAKKYQLGIYSPLCLNRQSKTDCQIKANRRAGIKIYHLPNCKNYQQVIIDEAFGDQWFCTEEEAIKAGFKKAAGCK